MKENEEITIIPSKSFVFVGLESEWKEVIQDSKSQTCKALLLTNDNALEVKELIWCEEKNALFVSPEKKNTFNIDDYSDNYNIYVSDKVTPLTNKTKPLIEKQEQERQQEEERRKRKQELQEKKIQNARVISLNELAAQKNTNSLYAINFNEGTNFQRELVSGKGCHGLGHNLHLVVGILINKIGAKKRIGKVIVCTTCGRTYLGSSVNKTIDINEYPGYTFNDWPESKERISNRELFDTLEKEEDKNNEKAIEERIRSRFISKAEVSRKEHQLKQPIKNNDIVLIDENTTVIFGDDLIHRKPAGHKLITCKVGLLNNAKDRYVFYKKTTYCPVCKKYYLYPTGSLKKLKEKHKNYQFEEGSLFIKQYEEETKRIQKEKEEKAERLLQQARKKKEEKEKKEQIIPPPQAKNIKAEDFLVRTSSFSCRRNGHKYKEITACVTLIRRNNKIQDVYLPGWYCESCKCYYILENDYEKLDRMGVIVAKVYTEKEWRDTQKAGRLFSELSPESILHKLGYNVTASQGLSDSTRQETLATAIDFKLMSKREVIDFLTWLINTRSGNYSMQNAVGKWEKDREFVSNYKLNTREFVRIKSIDLRKSMT